MAFRMRYSGDLAKLIRFVGQSRVKIACADDNAEYISLLAPLPIVDTGAGFETVQLGDIVYAMPDGSFRVRHECSCEQIPASMRKCPKCGKPVIGRRRKYCSPECRPSYTVPRANTCRNCGKSIPCGMHYCSDECIEHAIMARRRKCLICGKPADRTNSRYCSDECRKVAYDRRHPTHPCPICGKPIERRNRKACSAECSSELRRRRAMARSCDYVPTKYTDEFLQNLVTETRHDRSILRREYPREYRFIATHGLLKTLYPPTTFTDAQLGTMAKECGNDYNEFKRRYPKVLEYMCRNNVTKKYLNGCHEELAWNLPRCAEAAAKCDGRRDFFKRFQSAYQSARKHGWLDLLFPMMNKPKGKPCKYTFEFCRDLASSSTGPGDMRAKCRGAYDAMRRRGWNFAYLVSSDTVRT